MRGHIAKPTIYGKAVQGTPEPAAALALTPARRGCKAQRNVLYGSVLLPRFCCLAACCREAARWTWKQGDVARALQRCQEIQRACSCPASALKTAPCVAASAA